ncbi:phosphoribosylglycinamide formyltransferase [Luteirhabdus pelagi]|uniref:phosphoribosylglycinamide formyltransferase n=1 Tax=Luteirhabdus pelagi TaxID=2792783 RepID=UPI001939F9B0|nr:phosphoribosylglycinamide formyltransferase [Luteirhabdus pelagi]
MEKRIVIFASGTGSNAENIIQYFKQSKIVEVSMVLTNKPRAKVLEKAKKHNIKTLCFNREQLYDTDFVLKTLQKINPDLIVLAGFLWIFPTKLLNAFPYKVINLHPALLPKFGGKGMYGKHVHKAVVENKEAETGITIHYVNEAYDEGAIIAQKKVSLSPKDTPDTVAQKVHELEYEYLPQIIEKLLLDHSGSDSHTRKDDIHPPSKDRDQNTSKDG